MPRTAARPSSRVTAASLLRALPTRASSGSRISKSRWKIRQRSSAASSSTKSSARPPTKVARVTKLAEWLVKERLIPGADAEQVRTAARLAKADLVSQIVGEFPELQGTLGGYLARAQGQPAAVADAIRDHYRPAGQGDEVPSDPVTLAVNIADRLDTLVAFFSIDEKPTGSRDPFALRRAALGFLQMLTRNGLRLPLSDVLVQAAVLLIISRLGAIDTVTFPDLLEPDDDEHEITAEVGSFTYRHGDRVVVRWKASKTPTFERGQIIEEATGISEAILDFLEDRLKVQQREAGVRHDLIDAVFALGNEDDLVRLLARVKALQAFVGTEDGADLLTGYKRAANILKKEKWDGRREPTIPRLRVSTRGSRARRCAGRGRASRRAGGRGGGLRARDEGVVIAAGGQSTPSSTRLRSTTPIPRSASAG